MAEKTNLTEFSIEMPLNLIRIKIVIVGDICVGKTSIINQLIDGKFKEEYETSIGVDFFSKTLKFREKVIKLQIWDSAGQEKYRSLIPNYIHGSAIILLVFDITNKDSFTNLDKWIEFINNYEKPLIVLIANKIDLENNRVISKETAQEYADKHSLLLFKVSAKTGDGIKKMLFTSVSNLSYFSQLEEDIEKIASEMEQENNMMETNNTNRSNSSILDPEKGIGKFGKDTEENDTDIRVKGSTMARISEKFKTQIRKCYC